MYACMYIYFCILLLGALFFDNMGSNDLQIHFASSLYNIFRLHYLTSLLSTLCPYIACVLRSFSMLEFITTKQEGMPCPPLPHP